MKTDRIKINFYIFLVVFIVLQGVIFFGYYSVLNKYDKMLTHRTFVTKQIGIIKYNLSEAHIFTEEYIGGDESELDIIYDSFQKVKNSINYLLNVEREKNMTHNSKFRKNKAIVKTIERFAQEIDVFKQTAIKSAKASKNKINYSENTKYDKGYTTLVNKIEVFENRLDLTFVKVYSEFNSFKNIIYFIMLLLLFFTISIMYFLFKKSIKNTEIIKSQESMLIQQSRQAAMGEMIGNIAHQWRQPLNALGLTVQKIKMYHDEDILTSQNLNKSVDKSIILINKMSTTIDDFRNFFKINKIKEDFYIKDAVDEVINLIDTSLKSNNIQIDTSNIDKNIIFLGYKNELEQVLLNIINNAKDALIDNNIQSPKIVIKISVVNRNIFIKISDNAGGIPQDIINKIFEPYFTTKEQGKGTGIGLYMSKMIIENNMNGILSVQNSEKGAHFTIKLIKENNNVTI